MDLREKLEAASKDTPQLATESIKSSLEDTEKFNNMLMTTFLLKLEMFRLNRVN
jgi:hypothetical protein